MSLLSKKTKKRLEGVKDLAQTVAEKNPVVHALSTAKEVADSTYKIRHGKDPKYLRMLQPRQRKFAIKRKYDIPSLSKYAAPRVTKFEEDPIKRMIRIARMRGDHRLVRELRMLDR